VRRDAAVRKIVDQLTRAGQVSDTEHVRRRAASFGARAASAWGIGLGLVIAGLGIASLIGLT
jgi:hypothetical protein